jgi:hypothetical protein
LGSLFRYAIRMTDIGTIEEVTPAVVIPISEPIPSVNEPKDVPVEAPLPAEVEVEELEPVPA